MIDPTILIQRRYYWSTPVICMYGSKLNKTCLDASNRQSDEVLHLHPCVYHSLCIPKVSRNKFFTLKFDTERLTETTKSQPRNSTSNTQSFQALKRRQGWKSNPSDLVIYENGQVWHFELIKQNLPQQSWWRNKTRLIWSNSRGWRWKQHLLGQSRSLYTRLTMR